LIGWFDIMKAKQDPTVMAVLNAFPGSYIEAIDKPEEPKQMDFSPTAAPSSFNEAFGEMLDVKLATAKNGARAKYMAENEDARRPAIGAGRLGNECHRALGYEFHRFPVDPGREPTGKLHRIFDRGHDAEERMAEYLRLVGFTLMTARPDGKQFRFDVVKYDDGKGRIKGMVDGIFTGGPEYIGKTKLVYPFVWENKELGSKAFNKIKKEGLEKAKPEYYAQCQLNMTYLGLHENPCLITVKNADTQEVQYIQVPYDTAAAQKISDRGVTVVKANSVEELPRVARDDTDYRCKFCDFRVRCWTEAVPVQPSQAVLKNFIAGKDPVSVTTETIPAAPAGSNWLAKGNP
jgi:hypothetical protein